jgi:tetratricopeptide (TPR) repeat protein
VCALSVACGSTGARVDQEDLVWAELRANGIDPESLVLPYELTDEMKQWVRSNVRPRANEEDRLDELLAAMVGRDGLGIDYRRDYTGTAAEVFESREANCLSFTNLFVGLAREVGINAYYLTIRRRPSYDKEGDLVVRWEHVTAGWGSGAQRKVLEFSLLPLEDYVGDRKISDLTALAMFYSNRGAELLLAGDTGGSLEWLETAVILDPGWSHAWLNLGVVRRRQGDLAGAEAAYRRGIEENPDHLQLYGNLALLLQLRGEDDSAGELLRLLDSRSNRNPFAYLALGDAALREQRLEDAKRFYRRALQLNREDAESQAAMGLWELASQRPDRALGWLERAERIDPQASRVERLRTALQEAGELAAALEDAG